MSVLHVYLTLPRERDDASPTRRVLEHVAADAMEGRVQLLTNVPIGPTSGVDVHEVESGTLPRASGDWAQFARTNVLAFAKALEAVHGPLADVVAQGWASLPAAERFARRKGARLKLVAHSEQPSTSESPQREVLASARERGVELDDSGASLVEDRALEVGLGDGAPWDLADYVTTRFPKTIVVKGLAPDEQARELARAEVVLVPPGGHHGAEVVRAALDAGTLPVLLGSGSSVPGLDAHALPAAADGRELEALLGQCLGNRVARSRLVSRARRSVASARGRLESAGSRPLEIVLNHGGLVAKDLAQSVGPLGWDVRSLADEGLGALAKASFLVVLPYGDPRGALAALRRANEGGIPTVFWNVEDPRYFFDGQLGPLVRDLAREASLVFSTTLQLSREYGELGVQVSFLPVYGRGYFLAEAMPATRPIDLLFLGMLTPERRAFLAELRELLPDLKLVTRDDMREPRSLLDLVSSAKLGLAYGTLTDAATPHGVLRSDGVTERVFDYPLAGTPVLSDERGHLRELLVPGEEVFVFKDAKDAAEQVRSLLADPERRERVVAQARERVLREHLGRHRMLEIAGALVEKGLLEAGFGESVARARELSLAADAHLTNTLVSVGS